MTLIFDLKNLTRPRTLYLCCDVGYVKIEQGNAETKSMKGKEFGDRRTDMGKTDAQWGQKLYNIT